MTTLQLILALIGSVSSEIPKGTMETIRAAVHSTGESAPVISVTSPEQGGAPAVSTATTYLANTAPYLSGTTCIGHRYAVVVPTKPDAPQTPRVYAYTTVSFRSGCQMIAAADYAQVQPSGLSRDRMQDILGLVSERWSQSKRDTTMRFECPGKSVSFTCPRSPYDLARLAPLANVRIVQLTQTAVNLTFATGGPLVTDVSIPLQSNSVITVTQKAIPPL